MAGGAGHGPVGRQSAIEEKLLAEGDFLKGFRGVRGYLGQGLLDRGANLLDGSGTGQRTRGGDRRRFRSGWRRRPGRRSFRFRPRAWTHPSSGEDQRDRRHRQPKSQAPWARAEKNMGISSQLREARWQSPRPDLQMVRKNILISWKSLFQFLGAGPYESREISGAAAGNQVAVLHDLLSIIRPPHF